MKTLIAILLFPVATWAAYLPNTSIVSTNNSSTTTLDAGATYTGTWEDVLQFPAIAVAGAANVPGTLFAEFSDNGSNNLASFRSLQLTDGTTTNYGTHALSRSARYFRLRVLNGSTTQTTFAVTSLLSGAPLVALLTSRLTQPLNNNTDALNVRAALVGQTEGGQIWQPISAEGEGHLEVSLQSPRTAFGEVAVANLTPFVQLDWVYGLNSNTLNFVSTGSGTVSSIDGLLLVASGAGSNSVGAVNSRRLIKYRDGQGALARYTALYTNSVLNNMQLVGAGTESDGFFFGYWTNQVFGIIHRNNGTENFIPRTSWNEDLVNGSNTSTNKSGFNFNPLFGNVMGIQWQYLGFGNVRFYIENPTNSQHVLVHTIRYPNQYTTPSLRNPTLPLRVESRNYNTVSNVTVKSASMAGFLEGTSVELGPKYGFSTNRTSVTTIIPIFTVKVASNFNGQVCTSILRLKTIAFGANTGGAGSGIVTLKVIRNATLGGSPAFVATDGTAADNGATVTGNAFSSVDVAASSATGGTILYNAIVAVGNSALQEVKDLDLFAGTGDTLTITIESTQSCTAGAGVTWREDL